MPKAARPPRAERGTDTKEARVLAVMPLDEAVLFPGGSLELAVRQPRLLALVEEAVRDHQDIVLVARRQPGAHEAGVDELFRVGTVARIAGVSTRGAEGCVLRVEGTRRVRLAEFVQKSPHARARVAPLADEGAEGTSLQRRFEALKSQGARLLRLERRGAEAVAQLMAIRHPGQLADALAQALDVPVEAKQAVLESLDVAARLQRARALVAQRRRMLDSRGLPSPYFVSYLLTLSVLGAHLSVEHIGWQTPMGGALWLVEAVSALGVLVEGWRWLR